jgi:hypothetical protein
VPCHSGMYTGTKCRDDHIRAVGERELLNPQSLRGTVVSRDVIGREQYMNKREQSVQHHGPQSPPSIVYGGMVS